MSDSSHAAFHKEYPFAGEPPFLIFYEIYNEVRYYKVRDRGCSTRDLFKATRYPIEDYTEQVRSESFERPWPSLAALPISIQLPTCGLARAYAGGRCILESPYVSESFYHNALRAGLDLVRPILCGGGPFGPAVKLGPEGGEGNSVSLITAELLFFPEPNARVPESLRRLTRLSENHFKANRGSVPDGVILNQP